MQFQKTHIGFYLHLMGTRHTYPSLRAQAALRGDDNKVPQLHTSQSEPLDSTYPVKPTL